MAKEKAKNLIPMSKRSPKERKELGSKGGKKSAEKKKQQRTLSEIVSRIFNMPLSSLSEEEKEALKGADFTEDEITNGVAIGNKLIRMALSPDVEDNVRLRAIATIYKIIDTQKIDITTNGKDITREPLLIEVIDSREQVVQEEDDAEETTSN